MIVIVDYGMGNVGSIRNMLASAGSESVITADLEQIRSADRVILPGVGAFDAGMRSLAERGLIETLNEVALVRRVPMLGICLGMQLMCRSSEEGQLPGLGWIDAGFHRFVTEPGSNLKVPHMGWNTVAVKKPNPLIADGDEQRFYFVHTYHAVCDHREDVLATAYHGRDFDAAFSRGNLLGVQFHPEKSHRFGRALMTRFVELPC